MADKRFFDRAGPFTLEQLAVHTGATLPDNSKKTIIMEDVAPLQTATANQVSFFSNKKYLDEFKQSSAGACFIEAAYKGEAPQTMALLVHPNPYLAYALAATLFYPSEKTSDYRHPSALVHETAKVGKDCYIDAGCVIEAGVEIGEGTFIGPYSVIGRGVAIGKNCQIKASVTISHAMLGNDVILHPGVRIGQDGFGFAQDKGMHVKVPQLGRVIIGNQVEIGANSCIDRGAGPDTVIGDMCKIDNLVQIGHNVVLGRGCIVVAQVGIAGSTAIGDYVVLGGQVGVAGHLHIGSFVQVAAQSGVVKNVEAKQTMGGYPAMPIKQWHRQTIKLKQLTEKSE